MRRGGPEIARAPRTGAISSSTGVRETGDRERVRCLYDVVAELARVHSLETAIPAILSTIARALPLRSGVFTRRTAGRRETLLWEGEGQLPRMPLAKAHARKAYASLGIDDGTERASTSSVPPAPSGEAERDAFLCLPFALADGTIFGALLLECVNHPDERDLAFANAVVNLLAIALDRQERGILAHGGPVQGLEAPRREQAWHLLADVGGALAGALDHRAAFHEVARLVVPAMGEACLIDVAREDGTWERIDAAADLRWLAAFRELAIVHTAGPARVDLAIVRPHALLEATGLRSVLSAPLVVAGRVEGGITFLSTEPNRYTPEDVAVAEAIARAVALTLHNATLHALANKATRSREELLEIVSHDLRSPLSVVVMVLSSLLRSPPRDDRGRRDLRELEIMKRATDRMTGLLGDLLDSASMASGNFAVHPLEIAVAPLVARAIEAAQVMAQRKGLALVADVDEALPFVRADATRIQQVLANLLDNAIKFTPPHGCVTVRARRADDASGRAVRFSVSDTGPGIPEDQRAHLFDRFWQAHATAKMGTGLGLYIARTIVESHDGKIWVESTLGVGTTFSFALPASPREDD